MKKAIVSAIFTAGVLILLGVLVTGCSQTPQPPRAPAEMIKDGIKKLHSIDSHSFDVALESDFKTPEGAPPAKITFKLNLNGGLDLKNPQDPRLNLKIDGSGRGVDNSGKNENQNADVSLELGLNKEAVYANLAKLTLQGPIALPKDFEGYIGKWWKLPIPADILKEFAANAQHFNDDSKLTPEQQKIKELTENTFLFKDVRYVGVDIVKGEQSYRYAAALDKQALGEYLKKLFEIGYGKILSTEELVGMDDVLGNADFSGDLWVGKDSLVLNQVSGDIKFLGSAKMPTGQGKVNLRFTLWNFNKPVEVSAPKDAVLIPLESLIGTLSSGMFKQGGAQSSAPALNPSQQTQQPSAADSQEIVP